MPASLPRPRSAPVWLFDLDNTLHDASHAVFWRLDESMTGYIARELGLPHDEADFMRRDYWRRYGATLLGLERHHGIRAAHFLDHTHRLPGLEAQLRMAARDRQALKRLPGRKLVLTNAPADYARRVLTALGLASCFEAVLSIEHMRVFGSLRPKPDARMLRVALARLRLHAAQTVLVEDTLGHLRSARKVGMRTVWMQRYLMSTPRPDEPAAPRGGENTMERPGGCVTPKPNVRSIAQGPEVGVHLHRKPGYVCARIRSLSELSRHIGTMRL